MYDGGGYFWKVQFRVFASAIFKGELATREPPFSNIGKGEQAHQQLLIHPGKQKRAYSKPLVCREKVNFGTENIFNFCFR